MRRLSCDTCWFVHNSPFQIITFLHYHCSLKFDCIWGELEIKLYQEYKVFCTWANRLILVTEMKYLSFICLISVLIVAILPAWIWYYFQLHSGTITIYGTHLWNNIAVFKFYGFFDFKHVIEFHLLFMPIDTTIDCHQTGWASRVICNLMFCLSSYSNNIHKPKAITICILWSHPNFY